MITTSRHLHDVEKERDTEREENGRLRARIAELEKGIEGAQVVVSSVSRAAGLIDSEQVKDLRRQLDQRDRDVRGLTEELAVAHAAVSAKYDGSEWASGSETDAEKLHRAEDRAKALEERLAVLQAANEAMDVHHSTQPWIGEQQRAVTS